MKVILSKIYGFCFGIDRTVNLVTKELEKRGTVYCLGNLTHNEYVMNRLKKKGLIVIEDINEAENHIVFRAHGVTKELYKQAENLNLEIVDLSCPTVLKVHETADKYQKEGYFILLLGKAKHPEIIGTKSYCGEDSFIIETKEDINDAVKAISKDKVLIMSQTTFNITQYDEIVKILKQKIKNKQIKIEFTICNATDTRQKEIRELSKKVDFLVVVGGKKSDNTKELYEIAISNCNATIIQDVEGIDSNMLKQYNTIGVTSGASTVKEKVEEVVEYITTL